MYPVCLLGCFSFVWGGGNIAFNNGAVFKAHKCTGLIIDMLVFISLISKIYNMEELTEGGREDGSGGLGRGSSSIGYVEKVNCGVCIYFQSSDFRAIPNVSKIVYIPCKNFLPVAHQFPS